MYSFPDDHHQPGVRKVRVMSRVKATPIFLGEVTRAARFELYLRYRCPECILNQNLNIIYIYIYIYIVVLSYIDN